jgi:cytochrome c peroxidase
MSSKNQILKLTIIGVLLGSIVVFSFCKRAAVPPIAAKAEFENKNDGRLNEPISPIPTEVRLNSGKVALGETLFNDPNFSHDNSVSCASCHSLSLGGTDNLTHSTGINGQTGSVNAPTVFNSGYNFRQFWDGRAETLEDQIDGPTHASGEMGSSWEEINKKLNAKPEYVSGFANLYRDGINTQNIKDAIASFERSPITPNARFDQYLRGNQEILTDDEKEGYRIFKAVGCVSCHQGLNIGGNLFQEFGVMGDYFDDRGNITQADLGRYNVTNKEYDKYVFKVPSLRNVEHIFPYFHDGSAKCLENAVEVMSKYQLGRKLSNQEIEFIVKFLKTLNGDYQKYNQ